MENILKQFEQDTKINYESLPKPITPEYIYNCPVQKRNAIFKEIIDDYKKRKVDLELSIGDFVLTGGELPSMIITDSIVRLVDGVIDEESHINDSFNEEYLLDYPTYTKPSDFRGMKVPDVLVNGNHEEIKKYRLEEQIKKTKEKRPDLLDK